MKLYAPTPDGTKEMLQDFNEPSDETLLKVELEQSINRLIDMVGREATKEIINNTLENNAKLQGKRPPSQKVHLSR